MNDLLIGVGLGAGMCVAGALAGAWVWLRSSTYRAAESGLGSAISDPEQSALFAAGSAIPIHPSLPSSALPCRPQPRMPRRRIPAWSCGDTFPFPGRGHTHPGIVVAAFEPRSAQPASAQAQPAAGTSTTPRAWRRKAWRLLLLGAGVYLPVFPLTWLATTSLQPPTSLLLATQGWITLAVSLSVVSCLRSAGESGQESHCVDLGQAGKQAS